MRPTVEVAWKPERKTGVETDEGKRVWYGQGKRGGAVRDRKGQGEQREGRKVWAGGDSGANEVVDART